MSQYNPATGEFDFAIALKSMANRKAVRRNGWGNKSGILYVGINHPDADDQITQPYLYMRTSDNQVVPWSPNNSDILSVDWVEFIEVQ